MATVTRSGGTFVEGNIYAAGSYHWANLGNLAASDNSRATVTRSGPNIYPYTPIITNFGFTIPAGSVINSITVNIEALKSKTGESLSRLDWVSLMFEGSPTLMHASCSMPANITPDMPLTESDRIYAIIPSTSPLWGTTWTAADVNDTTFGCAFDCMMNELNMIIYVDHVSITIDYTEDTPEPESNCYGIPCDVQVNFEQALLRSIATATDGWWEGCTGLRIYPVEETCEDLTELKECGETFTLEQAFKRALIVDECGNYALRVFTLSRGEGPR